MTAWTNERKSHSEKALCLYQPVYLEVHGPQLEIEKDKAHSIENRSEQKGLF